MRLVLFFVCLTLTLTGCGPRYIDYFPNHDDGTSKPTLVLFPVIDSSQSESSREISEDLNQSFQYQMMHEGNLYVLSEQEIGMDAQQLKEIDPFDEDISFAKNFRNADFLVALELIGREAEPCENHKSAPQYGPQSHLCTKVHLQKMRIKVIDVRNPQPVIVLHEIFVTRCLGPKGGVDTHARELLVRDVVGRIINVTWGAK